MRPEQESLGITWSGILQLGCPICCRTKTIAAADRNSQHRPQARSLSLSIIMAALSTTVSVAHPFSITVAFSVTEQGVAGRCLVCKHSSHVTGISKATVGVCYIRSHELCHIRKAKAWSKNVNNYSHAPLKPWKTNFISYYGCLTLALTITTTDSFLLKWKILTDVAASQKTAKTNKLLQINRERLLQNKYTSKQQCQSSMCQEKS